MRVVRKVFAYITWGKRLLVFEHPYAPEAGIQVPAGTIKPDESPDEAVIREAFEETNLQALRLQAMIGQQLRDMRDYARHELHERYFFHLTFDGDSPKRWHHYETFSDDGSSPHLFELYWVQMPHEVPDLIADHGFCLDVLYKHCNIT